MEKKNTYIEYNLLTYLTDYMKKDADNFKTAANVPTGYANLDKVTKLFPGLYVIGAITSLGKTTFIHQMCDQLAKQGRDIVYFSLEQSVIEMTSKSLARIMAQKNEENPNWGCPLTALEIRMNMDDERVIEASKEYSQYAANFTMLDCSFNMTIKDIEDYVNNYINTRKEKPIVVIDYLQIINLENKSNNSKDNIDTIVKRLKQLQKDHNLTLIVISSFNRQNYMTEIDYESFKESGGIEYSADVLWGLQLEVLHDDIFNKTNNINEKREKVREAKKENPRKIELVCLKDRYGISSYTRNFLYYSANDLFVPNNKDDMKEEFFRSSINIPNRKGFINVPKNYTNDINSIFE